MAKEKMNRSNIGYSVHLVKQGSFQAQFVQFYNRVFPFLLLLLLGNIALGVILQNKLFLYLLLGLFILVIVGGFLRQVFNLWDYGKIRFDQKHIIIRESGAAPILYSLDNISSIEIEITYPTLGMVAESTRQQGFSRLHFPAIHRPKWSKTYEPTINRLAFVFKAPHGQNTLNPEYEFRIDQPSEITSVKHSMRFWQEKGIKVNLKEFGKALSLPETQL